MGFPNKKFIINSEVKTEMHKYIISRNTVKIKLLENKLSYEKYLRDGTPINIRLDYYINLWCYSMNRMTKILYAFMIGLFLFTFAIPLLRSLF